MENLPLWALALIFVAAAAVTWVAGVQLSKTVDVLDARLHVGSALGGLVVLAVATNLPEIAITVSAALQGDVSVAVGNILGGIAIQTVVLVVLDVGGRRRGGRDPLTHRAASLTLVIEGVVVVAVLTAVVAGSQLPDGLVFLRLTPDVVLIAALWIVGLLLVQRAGRGLPWHEDGRAPGATGHASHPHRHRRGVRHGTGSGAGSGSGSGSAKTKTKTKQMSTAKAAIVFAASALATLVAGVVLERSGDAASSQLGLSGVLFGATVLALATSLPEISTGLQAVRQGDDELAVSDIFGGNAFLPVLFLVATVISGQAVLPSADASNVFLTAVAALLTLVYVVGLLFRPQRRVLGMGVDSFVVLVLYLVGLGGLFAIAG